MHNLYIFMVVFSLPVWTSIETSLHSWEIINNTILKFEINPQSRVFAYFWRGFLACFAASANQFYIFRQCTDIVFILQNRKVQNNSVPNCLKIAGTSVVLNVFKGFRDVSAIVRFGHSRFGHRLYLISMDEETECRSLYFSMDY
jgi:hypothetical protein